MKNLLTVAVAVMTLVAATAAFADQTFAESDGPIPVPVYNQPNQTTQPTMMVQPMPAPQPVELFQFVRVKDEKHIAPCAVPMIVQVKDPCYCDPCNKCAVKCVNVQICVPQCNCPPKVTCRKDGAYVKYDFGKYKVEITSRKGLVTVDYDR